jgi:SAM-dependent methyltransferase
MNNPNQDNPNRDQSDRWNSGDDGLHWVAEKERYDRMLEPFLEIVLEAVRLEQGEDVLDIGCGSGATTLAAARLVAPGKAVGLDISEPLLERARDDAVQGGIGNVSFERGDAQVFRFALSFDVVISRFGVLFFEDSAAAFANLRTACRPGGRFVFVSWQPMIENEWLVVPGAALAEHVALPEPVPPNAPGMFRLSAPDEVRDLLVGAGWNDVTLTSRHASMLLGGGGSIDETLGFLRSGSLGRTMLKGVDADTEARAVRSLRQVLEGRAHGDGARFDAAVWLVRASA